MNWKDWIKFGLYRNRRHLGKKYQRGWKGVSIVILAEDSVTKPASFRLNYFLLLFLICLVSFPPLVAGTVLFDRKGPTFRREPAFESRLALLSMSRLFIEEKEQLLHQVAFQIDNLEKNSYAERWSFFRNLVSFRSTSVPKIRIEPGLDRFGYDLKLISRLKLQARHILSRKAQDSLNPLWSRAAIYYIVPRGWALKGQVGKITSPYGSRANPMGGGTEFHSGVDFAHQIGTPIIATAPGIVVRAESQGRNGYGKFVRIHHGLGYTTLYAHCNSITVNKGEFVKRGEVVGYLGRTGRTTGPHLHYEFQLGIDASSDPMPYVRLP